MRSLCVSVTTQEELQGEVSMHCFPSCWACLPGCCTPQGRQLLKTELCDMVVAGSRGIGQRGRGELEMMGAEDLMLL